MNRASTNTAQDAAAKPAQRPLPGPTLIDPQLLKLIAGGGAPKGGWAAADLSTSTTTATSAPKGGW
jgi:hypothetical protein